MEVSPRALRKDTVQVYTNAKHLLDQVELDEGLPPVKRTQLRASLLQTKSQCLNTLTLLSEQANKTRIGHRSDKR